MACFTRQLLGGHQLGEEMVDPAVVRAVFYERALTEDPDATYQRMRAARENEVLRGRVVHQPKRDFQGA